MRRTERKIIIAGLVFASYLCAVPCSHASDTPDTGFVALDAAAYSGVIKNNILYLGGAFTTVEGSSFPKIAAIDLAQNTPGAVWKPSPNAAVRALAISGTTLYAGGDFTEIEGGSRAYLAALDTTETAGNIDTGWNPAPNGAVRTMVLSPNGATLYIGGDFTQVGDSARNHLASVSTASGAVLPWDPNADGVVRTLVLSSDGATLYVGGDFNTIGGQARRGLAAVQLVNGKATDWDAAMTGAGVYSLVLSGTTLYAGGSFSQIGGQARNNLAALATALNSNMAADWNPDVDGTVHSIALSGDTRLYAGGAFSTVNGAIARSRVAAFRTDKPSADVIAWNPGFDSAITAIDFLLTTAGGDALYAGGDFTRIGATNLAGLAAFGIAAPQTASDHAGGGYQSLSQVTLTCTDRSGAGCAEIYYTVDGSDPATPVSYTAPVNIAIGADTTLKYFSVDTDGNREALNTAFYALDTTAPTTINSLPAALYGSANVQDVVLTCDDDNLALGCTTYYTLDGTAPSTASAVYTEPISLADLFPPADIDPEEVDPLLHLAGTVTLKYFSMDDAGNVGAVQTVIYQIDLSGPRAVASHATGGYSAPIEVTLTCNDGTGSGCTEMYYTTDNTPPSDGIITDAAGIVIPRTARYTSPIALSSAAVLRVLARDNAGNQSSGIVGIYSFTSDVDGDRNSVGGLDYLMLLLLALGGVMRYVVRSQA